MTVYCWNETKCWICGLFHTKCSWSGSGTPWDNYMSQRHANTLSHPGHYLVDPYTWPNGHQMVTVVVMNDLLSSPFVQCQSALPFWDTAISKFDHENPWSRPCVRSKVKVTFDLENSKVKVMVKVEPSHIWGLEFNRYLVFISWQSDHFWLRYSKFHIWPWKFKVKVMAKVTSNGHIWGLTFNWYICFSFHGNWTIFGWDIANSIFNLEISRSRSWLRSNLMVTFEAQLEWSGRAWLHQRPTVLHSVLVILFWPSPYGIPAVTSDDYIHYRWKKVQLIEAKWCITGSENDRFAYLASNYYLNQC